MTKNPLDRLASLGEEVLGKASQSPTAAKMIQAVAQTKERLDDLTKRVRGLEAMEQRVAQLEKRLAKLEGSGTAKKASSASSAKKKSATKKA